MEAAESRKYLSPRECQQIVKKLGGERSLILTLGEADRIGQKYAGDEGLRKKRDEEIAECDRRIRDDAAREISTREKRERVISDFIKYLKERDEIKTVKDNVRRFKKRYQKRC